MNFPDVPIEKLLSFWKHHENEIPKLAVFAKRVLCVPVTSASSERNFSAAGYLTQERRTRLKPSTVDNLLFLRKNT